MTEQELRGLVRQAIARHIGAPEAGHAAGHTVSPDAGVFYRRHASHAVLAMVQAVEPGAPCVIEPATPCNQCGYCKSLGH